MMQARRSTPTPARSPRSSTRLFAAVAALAVVAGLVVYATAPSPAPRTTYSTVEEGGLEWGAIDIVEASELDGEGSIVSTTVLLDDEHFPTADSRDDRFVLFQLDGGRFDIDRYVDDAEAERVIGIDDDDTVQLFATEKADGSSLPAGTGRYAMSLDGSIEYRDIPSGTYELRALVVDRTGAWDGPIAAREVRVP